MQASTFSQSLELELAVITAHGHRLYRVIGNLTTLPYRRLALSRGVRPLDEQLIVPRRVDAAARVIDHATRIG
jgi:hypothetical protein